MTSLTQAGLTEHEKNKSGNLDIEDLKGNFNKYDVMVKVVKANFLTAHGFNEIPKKPYKVVQVSMLFSMFTTPGGFSSLFFSMCRIGENASFVFVLHLSYIYFILSPLCLCMTLFHVYVLFILLFALL